MKNKLIILLLLFVTLQTNAQDYHKLLDTGKVWYDVHIGEFGYIYAENNTPDYNNMYYANDTAYLPIGPHPYAISLIVREDTITKKVYKRSFTDHNTPLYPEDIIYDFSLQEGDSIYYPSVTNICSGTGWFYIDSIRTISYFGTERNVFYLNNHYPNAPNTIWIEGIGSLGGVQYFNAFPMIWECGELTCCYHNDELLYQSANGEHWGCSFENVDIDELVNNTIRIYPNPANQSFTIDLSAGGEAETLILRLYDIYGKCVKQKKIHSIKEQTNISTLPYGLYLLKISSDNKTLYSNKIIKL